MTKKQPRKLAQARAFFRLAAKADLAGKFEQGRRYRERAERLVEENRRTTDYIRRTFGEPKKEARPCPAAPPAS